MRFEWDNDKARRNLQKHGIDFDDAVLVFYDFGRIEQFDSDGDYGEDRWATVGLAHSVLIYVVYTVRANETIRIISARKANAKERGEYSNAQH